MAQLNFHINDDTQAKLLWLAEQSDDTQAGVVRKLINNAFDIKKTEIEKDIEFISFIRAKQK